MEATQCMHHHLKKTLGDACHIAEQLGEAIHSQNHMEPVIRESADGKQPSAAHSTASLGLADRSRLQESSKNFNRIVSWSMLIPPCIAIYPLKNSRTPPYLEVCCGFF